MSNNGQNDNQQQPNIDDRNILSQLFSRLDELSNAISPTGRGDIAFESSSNLENSWLNILRPSIFGCC